MIDRLEEYRRINNELTHVKEFNNGNESEEEDQLLEELDNLWWGLSNREREIIESESY
jgi:hypothetical protein